jgi:hypothetical protein
MSTEKCDCYIDTDAELIGEDWKNRDRIRYCPLHSAAGAMREALAATLQNLHDMRDELPMRDTRESHARIIEAGNAARAALAQAEGKAQP